MWLSPPYRLQDVHIVCLSLVREKLSSANTHTATTGRDKVPPAVVVPPDPSHKVHVTQNRYDIRTIDGIRTRVQHCFVRGQKQRLGKTSQEPGMYRRSVRPPFASFAIPLQSLHTKSFDRSECPFAYTVSTGPTPMGVSCDEGSGSEQCHMSSGTTWIVKRPVGGVD